MITKYDKNLIEQYIEEGLLIRQWHSSLPLQILNYSRKCEYEEFWNDITKSCRSLILDKDYKLVCGNMSKFWNFYQHSDEDKEKIVKRMNSGKFIVQTKWDGTLGTIFEYNGQIVCASKGSFDSFVTKEMYKMIKDKLFINDLETVKSNLVVEVISPETHILCNYGDKRELRVITAYRRDRENNDYFEWPYEETLNIIKNIDPKQELLKPIETFNMNFEQLQEWTKTKQDKLEEGFVVRFTDNENEPIQRVKFKSEDYLACSALKANTDPIHLCNMALNLLSTKENQKIYKDSWVDYLYKQVEQIPEDEVRDTGNKMVLNLYAKTEFIYDKYFMINEKYKHLTNKEIGLSQDPKVKKYKDWIYAIRNDSPIISKWLIQEAKKEYQKWEALSENEKEKIKAERQKNYYQVVINS